MIPEILGDVEITWGQFREKCGSKWNWSQPEDEKYVTLQRHNREKMMKMWNKFGEAILQHYRDNGNDIKYVPYTSVDDVYNSN